MSISSTRWRIYVDQQSGGAEHTSILEIEMAESLGGADQCSGGTATDSSHHSAGTVGAYAFDNNFSNAWTGETTQDEWVEYEFTGTKTITYLRLWGSGYDVNYSPHDWRLQAYVAGDWVDVYTMEGEPAWLLGEQRIYGDGIKLFSPTQKTNSTTPSPTVVTASSTYDESSYGGWAAFKTVSASTGANNYWLDKDGVSPTCWLKLDLGAGNTKTCVSYALQVNFIPEASRAPKAWTLQGSNNDSDWDTLDTVSGQTSWGSGETRYFTCDTATTAYRYFKINITENNGDGTYTQINNLFLFEAGVAFEAGVQTYSYTATGGAIAGGSATITAGVDSTSVGGAVAGYSAGFIASTSHDSSGGGVCGGEAGTGVTSSYSYTALGGGIAGGVASYTRGVAVSAGGGGICSGVAGLVRATSIIAAGGGVGGGASILIRGRVHSSLGGGIAGGIAALEIRRDIVKLSGPHWHVNSSHNPVWGFVEQPNKWGYLNNPEWSHTDDRTTYDNNPEDEPIVWPFTPLDK